MPSTRLLICTPRRTCPSHSGLAQFGLCNDQNLPDKGLSCVLLRCFEPFRFRVVSGFFVASVDDLLGGYVRLVLFTVPVSSWSCVKQQSSMIESTRCLMNPVTGPVKNGLNIICFTGSFMNLYDFKHRLKIPTKRPQNPCFSRLLLRPSPKPKGCRFNSVRLGIINYCRIVACWRGLHDLSLSSHMGTFRGNAISLLHDKGFNVSSINIHHDICLFPSFTNPSANGVVCIGSVICSSIEKRLKSVWILCQFGRTQSISHFC